MPLRQAESPQGLLPPLPVSPSNPGLLTAPLRRADGFGRPVLSLTCTTMFFCVHACTNPVLRPCVEGSVGLCSLEAAESVTSTHVYSLWSREAGHSCRSARCCPWGGLLLGTVDIHHVVSRLLDEPGHSVGKDPTWDRWCLPWALSGSARLGRTRSFLTLIFGDPGSLMGSLRPWRLFQ